MGSFDYTCAISGLPIRSGDKVRFLLLQGSPYNRSGKYTKQPDSWYLRAPAIRAEYNDYGTIENIHPDDKAIAKLWLEGLSIDMIEKGIGDNTCHDAKVRKDMTFDELREALWERRVEVRREIYPRHHSEMMARFEKSQQLSKGVPSISTIEEVIKSSPDIIVKIEDNILKSADGIEIILVTKKSDGTDEEYTKNKFEKLTRHINDNAYALSTSTLGTESGQYIVDEVRRGEVRVRIGGYAGLQESLIYLNPLLQMLQNDYAAVITCGSGNYANPAELSIRPKPGALGSDGKYSFVITDFRSDDEELKKVPVRASMVREDVWQSLLTMHQDGITKDYKTVTRRIKDYRDDAKEVWREFVKRFVKVENRLSSDDELNDLMQESKFFIWRNSNHSAVGRFVFENPSIDGFSMNASWKIMATNNYEEKEIDNVLNVTAEAAFISDMLSTLRMRWRVEETTSPQFGEWRRHKEFQRLMWLFTGNSRGLTKRDKELKKQMQKDVLERKAIRKAIKKEK